MVWIRQRFPLCAPATLLLFLAMAAVPPAGFFVHTHRGGEHGHVHLQACPSSTGDGEIDALLADALGTPRHRPKKSGDAPTIERFAGTSTTHWHTQAPFQHVVAAKAPVLDGLTLLALVAAPKPDVTTAAPARHTRARSPPASLA